MKKKPSRKRSGEKLTKKEVEELRHTIFQLHLLSGVSLREIARQTGYNRITVNKHAKVVYDEAQDEIKSRFGREDIISRILLRKEDRLRRLQTIAVSEASLGDRMNAMKEAERIDNNTINLLQDIGVVPRNLGKLDVPQSTIKVFDLNMSEYLERKGE